MDFVKVRRHFLPVTPGYGFVSQHYKLTENGDLGEVVLFDGEIPFDAATGNEDAASLPVAWLLVGANTTEHLCYRDANGNETAELSVSGVTTDLFAGPSPLGLGSGDQVDQRDGVDERPTN